MSDVAADLRRLLLAGLLAVLLLTGCSDTDDTDQEGTTMDDRNTVAYEDGVLRVGTVHLAFPGYEVRRSGEVVVGWPSLRPGVEIISTDQPLSEPLARAVVFAQNEPIAEEPGRALLTAHQTLGLVDAPVTREDTIGDGQRRCHYSVAAGEMEGTDGVEAVSAAVVAVGGPPAVGVSLFGEDEAELGARIAEIAEALCR